VGHHRLGRYPPSRDWQRVAAILGSADGGANMVVSATEHAARSRLDALKDDPSLGYCFWLLSRLASAARRPDFATALGRLGLDARGSDSVFAFVSQVSDRVRDETGRYTASGPFGDLAADALTRALAETVGTEGRSLFGSSVGDLERALHKHATKARFATIAQRFFGDFLARTLRYYVDKELAQHVGKGRFRDVAESAAFMDELDRSARRTAGIVREFAGDWFSLHDHQTGGAIGHDEAQRFVAHALDKLREGIREPEA
jgi:hypothetical protein